MGLEYTTVVGKTTGAGVVKKVVVVVVGILVHIVDVVIIGTVLITLLTYVVFGTITKVILKIEKLKVKKKIIN